MLKDNVLISEVQKEATSAGGIILSGDISKASKPGLVLAVGPEVDGLEQGDRVFLTWAESLPVDVEGKQAVICSADSIKAVL